ncbi:MAG TPA: tetratricopeptide repeat protein [Dissulfurispiraceae bacterium]|nr:tetratricopeptide repeat protein [Dissulfurispiraceae bacterium]
MRSYAFLLSALFFAGTMLACSDSPGTGTSRSSGVSSEKTSAPDVKDAKKDLQALVRQGRKLARGDKNEQKEAVALFRKAADAGDAEGMGRLARAYRLGQGVQMDYAAAIKLYEQAIAAGYAAGKVGLGHMYRLGTGVEKDETKACDLYYSAAEQRIAGGMYYYGRCLEDGMGKLEKSPREAEQWYRKALEVDKDYCYVYIGLARLYTRGTGVEKNLEEAAKIYKRAEERGCAAPERLQE